MKTFVRVLLAFPLVAGLACSSDGGPDYATEIDSSTMGGAAETGVGFASDVVYNLMDGSPSADLPLAPAFEGSTFADRFLADLRVRATRRSGRPEGLASSPMHLVHAVCDPVETGIDELGDPIDSDNDNVPDDYKLSFPANCSETEGDWTYTYSGSVRLRDVTGLYGYRIDIGNLQYHEVNNVTHEEDTFKANGSEHALYAANSVTHSTHLAYTTSFSGPAAAPGPMTSADVTSSYTFYYDEETSFDPEGTISLDADIPSGDFDLDLTFRAIFTGGEQDGAFKFHLTTPTVLHFDTSVCNGIDDGVVRGALNNSESIYFLVTWTGCETTTYEAHGTSDGGATARQFTAR